MAQQIIGVENPSIQKTKAQPIGGITFDWLMTVLGAWVIGGFYLDGWAHFHNKVDTSFFTPWHFVLYSGFTVLLIALMATIVINHARGRAWGQALPSGYEITLFGALLFSLAGVGDMLWHTVFGIEKDIAALFSPTHLMLLVSSGLVVTGPIRAAWRRKSSFQNIVDALPTIISMTLLLAAIAFITLYASPFYTTPASIDEQVRVRNDVMITAGVTDIMFYTAILMGIILLMIRRFKLPFGSLTFMLTISVFLTTLISDKSHLVLGALIAGILCDVLLFVVKPSELAPIRFRIFAFFMPTIVYIVYFMTLQAYSAVWWSVHEWTGAIVLAGITGYLVSLLVLNPKVAIE